MFRIKRLLFLLFCIPALTFSTPANLEMGFAFGLPGGVNFTTSYWGNPEFPLLGRLYVGFSPVVTGFQGDLGMVLYQEEVTRHAIAAVYGCSARVEDSSELYLSGGCYLGPSYELRWKKNLQVQLGVGYMVANGLDGNWGPVIPLGQIGFSWRL